MPACLPQRQPTPGRPRPGRSEGSRRWAPAPGFLRGHGGHGLAPSGQAVAFYAAVPGPASLGSPNGRVTPSSEATRRPGSVSSNSPYSRQSSHRYTRIPASIVTTAPYGHRPPSPRPAHSCTHVSPMVRPCGGRAVVVERACPAHRRSSPAQRLNSGRQSHQLPTAAGPSRGPVSETHPASPFHRHAPAEDRDSAYEDHVQNDGCQRADEQGTQTAEPVAEEEHGALVPRKCRVWLADHRPRLPVVRGFRRAGTATCGTTVRRQPSGRSWPQALTTAFGVHAGHARRPAGDAGRRGSVCGDDRRIRWYGAYTSGCEHQASSARAPG